MENIPISVDKIAVSNEMPSGIERRLVLQLLGYWRSICREGRIPAFANLDLSEVPKIKPHSFALDLVGDGPTPVFTAAGRQLAMRAENTLIGLSTNDLPAETLPGAATAYIDEVLTKVAPVSRGGELVDQTGTKLFYRSILLPMSDDGETVSGILGAANSRIVQGEEATDDTSEEN